MVYEQITFFIKNRNFSKYVFGSKIDFLMGKSISGLKNQEKFGKIAKSTENANLPRIPMKTRGFLLKPGDS